MAPVTVRRPSPHHQAAAWFITGPLGHLLAGVTDVLVLLVRYLWARARGRPLGS